MSSPEDCLTLHEEGLKQESGQLRGLAGWFKETEKASQRSTRGHSHQGALSKWHFFPQYLLLIQLDFLLISCHSHEPSQMLKNLKEWRWVEVVTVFLRLVTASPISLISLREAICLLETTKAQEREWQKARVNSCLTYPFWMFQNLIFLFLYPLLLTCK